ncbi:TlpA family protein disulfide reductase [Flavobacterium sp.]|jgi:thiol-disulfide isomerase/thioredoxin|uniref:TlpA family protein disulfide reductase n=1 Tax=Flavobacterium sp. TaxID=239 RepID=UPI0037C0DFE4
MKKHLIAFLYLITTPFIFSQSISGNFSQLINQPIKVEGFSGLKTYAVSSTTTDEKGNFKLNYSKSDYGVGYLIASDNKPLFILLSGEDIVITGEALNVPETIKIAKGQENLFFEEYAKEHPRREQALSAWGYLEKIYTLDSLFSLQQKPITAILEEKQRIKKEDKVFLSSLPSDSYVKWFLPIRKLVSSVSTIAQYRPEEIPETIDAFRKLDYTDARLYKSGLFKDAIDNHFWLLENSGKSLDNVFEEMKLSIDGMLVKLATNEKIFNEVTDYLFDLLEKHSLFQASEYLALKVLNEGSCTINNDLANQLETYRAMKKGNIAPDMIFNPSFFVNPNKIVAKLSSLKSNYTVVVFGASWCPKCKEELPEIAKLYSKWKSKGVEVVFVALEEDRTAFINFAKGFPFISYSDNKKWESKIVKDYYVFSTPTIFLLDNKREIILRPNSVKQMDAWVDWYLK